MRYKAGICFCLLFLLFFLLPRCAKESSSQVDLSPVSWPEGELEKYAALNNKFGSPKPIAQGTKGMVVGVQNALAVRAGLEALKQGGSAADGAITTALTQIVLTAGATVSFAGIINMIYYDAASDRISFMNADWQTLMEEDDPLSIPFMGTPSGRTALVPGFMAGIQAAHDRFGKIPFSELFEAALYFAENGFVLGDRVARWINHEKEVLSRLPRTRQIFIKEDGEPYQADDIFKQPQLAETLRKVSRQGADYMYRGEWAEKYVDAVRSEGGKMTLKDLEDYRVIWSEPFQTSYRDYEVFVPSLPSVGGVFMVEALNLLESADLSLLGHYTASPEALYRLIQIARMAWLIQDLSQELKEKHFPGNDLSHQSRLKKETARIIWDKMRKPEWARLMKDIYDLRLKKAAWEMSVVESVKSKKHTDAVVTVDEEGNVAAVIHTCNCVGWGTTGIFVDGISIPDSGAFYQEDIEEAGPGARLSTNLCPLIVLRNGKPVLASGGAGFGLHQVSLQNLVNVLDYGMDPKTSEDTAHFMAASLVPSESNKQVIKEGDFSKELLDAVRAMGQELKIVSTYEELSLALGVWVGIKIDPVTGMIQGCGTQSSNGYALGY